MDIKQADSDAAIKQCFPVLKILRPHLDETTFVQLIQDMRSKGYRLIYIEENDEAVAVCGYRFTQHLAWGKPVYIDDLITMPRVRKKGYAGKLLDAVKEEALSKGFNQLHLDSGTFSERYDAHRFYLNYGFNITSFHFAMQL